MLDLSNPNKSVCLPLVKGKAAGRIELIHQLYPPRGVHRNSFPATYTFVLEDWVTEEIGLMVSMADTGEGGDGMILGFVSHDHWWSLRDRAGVDTSDAQQHYVVVKYNPTTREGFIYFYKEAYAIIEKANEHRLKSCRRLKQKESAPAKENAVKILYAEDDDNLRETMIALLEHCGYAVDAVENGHQLIGKLEVAVAAGVRYDLVITDNDMPRVTGLQVLQHIRSDERFKGLPVIVFSGSDIRRDVEDAGGVYFGKGKDYDPADLHALAKKMSKHVT
ncbi:MAG: response regulator [Patescibacteria group bacterium]